MTANEASWSTHMAFRFIRDYTLGRMGVRLCHLHEQGPEHCAKRGKNA